METTPEKQSGGDLKYLGFFKNATIQALVCVSSLYNHAKEYSGPLRSGVDAVEGTVKTVIGPVYEKVHGVPYELLVFFDRKVDETAKKLDHVLPPAVKELSCQTIHTVQKAPDVARDVYSEVKQSGVMNGSKNLYTKYEPAAVEYAVRTWHTLYKVPLFPQFAEIAVPSAAHWCDKYNQSVSFMAKRGVPVVGRLPTVPLEEISKTFQGKKKKTNGGEIEAEASG